MRANIKVVLDIKDYRFLLDLVAQLKALEGGNVYQSCWYKNFTDPYDESRETLSDQHYLEKYLPANVNVLKFH